jgi:hypothetical protein
LYTGGKIIITILSNTITWIKSYGPVKVTSKINFKRFSLINSNCLVIICIRYDDLFREVGVGDGFVLVELDETTDEVATIVAGTVVVATTDEGEADEVDVATA